MNNIQKDMVTTARITGVWYLILGITGMLGFLVFHPQLYVINDPEKTLANLTEHESLARIRLLLELAIVVSQALAAVWFYKLFKSINDWAALTLNIWGMMNSVAIMISAIAMGSAIAVAGSSTQSLNDKVVLIQVFGQLINNAWGVGSLFFGLWLIPMGYLVVSSKAMPAWLGRILIIGGVGYILNTFVNYTGLSNAWLDFLVLPATVGEFWMIGYLLVYGIRTSKD